MARLGAGPRCHDHHDLAPPPPALRLNVWVDIARVAIDADPKLYGEAIARALAAPEAFARRVD
eukprot:7047083-Lingulodinium_polyedra.AAC.1